MLKINDTFFYPFHKIGGIKSLILGVAVLLLLSTTAYLSHSRFDGVLDFHHGMQQLPFVIYLFDNIIVWISLLAIFYPVIMFITKGQARILDIAGMMLLSRFPLILQPFISFYLSQSKVIAFSEAKLLKTNIEYQIQILDWGLFIAAILFIMLITICYIWLLFHAFKVNSNMKGGKAVVIFIVCILSAEVLSKVILFFTKTFF